MGSNETCKSSSEESSQLPHNKRPLSYIQKQFDTYTIYYMSNRYHPPDLPDLTLSRYSAEIYCYFNEKRISY